MQFFYKDFYFCVQYDADNLLVNIFFSSQGFIPNNFITQQFPSVLCQNLSVLYLLSISLTSYYLLVICTSNNNKCLRLTGPMSYIVTRGPRNENSLSYSGAPDQSTINNLCISFIYIVVQLYGYDRKYSLLYFTLLTLLY